MTGKDLQDKLQENGYKTQAIADLLGIPAQNLYSIFRASSVKVDNLEAIAKVIGRPVTWFFDDGINNEAKNQNSNSTSQAIEVLRNQLQQKDKQIDRLLTIIEDLSSQTQKGDAASDATSADVG